MNTVHYISIDGGAFQELYYSSCEFTSYTTFSYDLN